MSNRRPRRAAARISYASAREYSDDDVEPEEELRRPARHVRTARMEDSDYELKDDMDEAAEASVDYEDDDESLGETEEEDHQPSEQFSDNEPHSQRKSKASKGPPSASNSIELKSAGKKTKQRMINLTTRLPGENKEKGINFDLPPLSDVKDIFHDMTEKALKLGLGKVSNHLQSRPLRVATMCSGTEAPLLALEMVNDVMKILSKEAFHLEHLFSAEIDPFKQAYIERNFQPPIIFRDITEITKAKDTTHTATTVYGAQVRIPDNLDLVIAGTSCKDFSGLNAHQKGLADGGESGDTFHAVLKYAELYRPRILILENVFNAPWDAMLEEYERIGYQVGGVLVDTKDFYLPQTRQRGYMVCLDKNHLASDTNAAERWTDLMRKFKRPASSSISAFLQPNDDPSAVQLKTQLAKLSQFDTVSREVDWSKCEIRHIRYRHAKGIGNARPYTNWQESGLLVVPDHADKVWHARQVERVWDMQDCSLLRKAHPNGGGYDVQFKTRVWDLSQNVDRFVDGTPFGITPCLTPTGIFFVTDRGGPLTFQECFKLQGIPLDKITFTTETRAQVQDMAGNAMSSTVVGSAILSALIAGSKILRHDHKLEPESSALAMSASQVTPITDGVLSNWNLTAAFSGMAVQELIQDAERSSRRCYCEAQTETSDKAVQTCQDCGHTTCLACGNKPMHNYSPDHKQKESRDAPSHFLQKWKSRFPTRLQLSPPVSLKSLLSGATKAYIAAVERATQDIFNFSQCRRRDSWTVIYVAPHASLELCLSGASAEWRLFARPDRELSGNDQLRHSLRQPIARSMCGTSLLGAQWEWRLPADTLFNLSIQGKGKKVPSWKARLNLPVSRDESMWQQLRIDLSSTERVVDIAGLYEYLPNCGTAGESLYKRISSRGKSMYLFWDPSRIGDPSMDGFVFANDCSRLEYDEIRQVTARLDPAWRPLTLPGKAFTSPQGFVDGHWTTSTGTKLDAVDTNLAVCTSDFITSSLGPIHDCSSASTLISFTIPTTAVVSPLWQQSSQRIGTHDKAFFTAFAWAFEPLNSLLRVPDWQFIDSTACGSGICDQCAPKTPQLRWKLHSGPKDTVRAYEDPASATSYELALKRRPDLFAVECSFRGSGSKNGSIKVGLNVPSMVHRALAKLHRVLEGKGTTPTASVKWKLDTHYVESHPTALPTFTLRGNDPGVSFTEQLKIEVGLWPKQLQSLAWMRAQEAGEGKRTVVEESEETLLPYLGWRAEARAQAPVHVRGGILADHPGFGKTVTSLTLVHSEFQSKSVEDILANMKDAKAHGFIKISATLVVCPKTLVKQWESEVKKVLGPVVHKQTIVISELAQLSRQKIQDFEAARIIVVNQDIFTHPTYVWRLARFAGVPYPSSVNRREFKAWLEFAINQIPAHLEILQQSGVRTLALEIERKFQAHLDDEQFQALVPSKRLTGKDYALKKFKDVNANNQQKNAKKDCTTTKKKASAPKDININLDKCLFEMFHFNRVIVDEFTYLKPKDKASILAIKADKRWALSATAPLRDPYDIAEIASLIGVPLRVGDNAPGLISSSNLKTIRDSMTDLERFQSFRNAPSHAVHSRICETAQEFLNDFVRQNILEFKDHPYIDSIVPVTLGLDHRIVYTELSERLNSQDMRIKKGNKKTASERDREQRVLESLSSATTAEQALLKQAACFSRAQGSGGETSGLVALLHKRESDCAAAEARLKIAIFQSQQMAAASYHNVDPLMMWKKSVVDDDILEDEETALSVASMIGAAERNHPLPESVLQKARKTKKKPSEGEQEDADEDIDGVSAAKEDSKEAGAAMRTQISETNQFAKRYRDAKRYIRFVHSCQRLQDPRDANEARARCCDCGGCAGNGLTTDHLAASSSCGHVICVDCLAVCKDKLGLCGAPGCRALVKDYDLLWAKKMGHVSSAANSEIDYGQKVTDVIELVQEIERKGDQGILFVSHESQIDQVSEAFTTCRIRHTTVKENVKPGQPSNENVIEDFKTDESEERSTVIILNGSNASAAGM